MVNTGRFTTGYKGNRVIGLKRQNITGGTPLGTLCHVIVSDVTFFMILTVFELCR